MSDSHYRLEELKHELEIEYLRSHERHMRHIYSLRWGGLIFSAAIVAAGVIMLFLGLQGSFNWAFDAPLTISSKITNASPGIVFAIIGLILGFVVITRKPVTYNTRTPDHMMMLGDPSRHMEAELKELRRRNRVQKS